MSERYDDLTVLIPIHRSKGNREWLQQAINSLKGVENIILLENDGEVVEALNHGLSLAKTEWVCAFGADDVAHPDFLKRMMGFAHNVDVIYHGFVFATEDLKATGIGKPPPFNGPQLERANFIPGSSIYRREKALEVGGYRDLGNLEDWDLWVRMWRAGAKFVEVPDAFIFYRIHDAGRNMEMRKRPELLNEIKDKIVGGEPTPVVGTFYAQNTPATTYVRCQLPAKYLPALVTQDLQMGVNDKGDAKFPGHEGDAAIFQFPGSGAVAAAAIGMRHIGIRTLVEVDDNYLINPGKKIVQRSNWCMKIGGGKPDSRQGHGLIARDADGIIVTTRLLANAYRKVNPSVYICPNTVDPSDWPEPEKPDDGIFRIAWIASRSHDVDIPLIVRALDWAARQKDVEVYVGQNTAGNFKFPHHIIPWAESLDIYRELFRHFDVCVAPIRRIPFALYRSDLKALESAMGLACPVLSDVEPYEDWTEDRCLKAADAKGFLHAIKHLVANRDEARQLAEAAREYVLKERTTEAQIHTWREAIAG